MMTKPELTIGLPVYNGGAHLAAALDSLLSQSFGDFVLLISDNASGDDTSSICQAAAARDSRIVYVRQPENIGIFANFRFVLERAETPFFMWAAHDDHWHEHFVDKNLALLKADPRAVASISRVAFHNDGVLAFRSASTYPLQGSVKQNLRRFWRFPADASRFYAIHRTDVLRQCTPVIPPYHAYDWLVVALTLLHGHYLEVPEVLMWRKAPEPDRYLKQVGRDNSALLLRIFPLLPISYYAIKFLKWRNLPAYFGNLLRLNLSNHQSYVAFVLKRYPRFFHPLRWIFRTSGLRRVFYRWKQHPKDVTPSP